jgi:RNA polymerase sigma-70 factor (ECF subfamily)
MLKHRGYQMARANASPDITAAMKELPDGAPPPIAPAATEGAPPFTCVTLAWRAHESELRGFLRHRVGDPHQVDDLLQDVFMRAMRAGQHFCVLAQPRAWLFEVARNAAIDFQRRQRPTVEVDDNLPAIEPEGGFPDLLAACLERQLQQMDANDASVLQACDLHGQRQQAFADAHGLSLAAAKARLSRARQRLRKRLVTHCAPQVEMDLNVCCARRPR